METLLHLHASIRHHCGQLLQKLDLLSAAHQPACLLWRSLWLWDKQGEFKMIIFEKITHIPLLWRNGSARISWNNILHNSLSAIGWLEFFTTFTHFFPSLRTPYNLFLHVCLYEFLQHFTYPVVNPTFSCGRNRLEPILDYTGWETGLTIMHGHNYCQIRIVKINLLT